MFSIRHLTPDDYRTLPWKNHRGTTSEIAIFPENVDFHTDPFLWRVSSAQLASSSGFSQFLGYDRTITLLEGDEMALNHDCKDAPERVRTLEPHEFKGEWQTTCEVGDKPVQDFNLIVRRGKIVSRFEVFGPSVAAPPTCDSRWMLVFCAAGSATVATGEQTTSLLVRETLLVDNPMRESFNFSVKYGNDDSRIILIQLSPSSV